LMGNKLVNINSVIESTTAVQEDDVLKTLDPIETDEMVRTLGITNENIKVISSNLRTITDKINSKNSLWSLLLDTIVADNLKTSIVNIRLMSNNAVMITGDLKGLSNKLKNGKGTLGTLITDTVFSERINHTIVNLNRISDSAAIITGNLGSIINKLKNGQGTVGVLLNDTSFIHNLNQSLETIKHGAGGFNENMEALKHSWPFRKYYRRKK
jgi:phospholipid/cholesterol/gamma-HCH transport system substrate-binding protein